MRVIILLTALLANTVTGLGANSASGAKGEASPICLTASDLSVATGQPSLKLMSSGAVQVPIWSLSGGTEGQSVAGVVTSFPSGCSAVKVEIIVTTTDPAASQDLEDVYRVHLTQLVEDAPFTASYHQGSPVRTRLSPHPLYTRNIILESYYETVPIAPLWVRIQREPGDPADTYTRPTGLVAVKITPVDAPARSHVVQDVTGYNSWPMMQAIGDKLVCVYSRGQGHTVGEDARAVYSRTSVDGGKTWTDETVVADTPGFGEVPVGKGLDSSGNMFLWVRRVGKTWHHDLYRSADGVKFELVATPPLPVKPVQITDIFEVPTVGLMALWFGGSYKEDDGHSWGTLTSRDHGATWDQIVVESDLHKSQWPTEPAAVYLGDGQIFAIARTDLAVNTTERAQFQMVSTDHGTTWTRQRTNIGDVTNSTPSLIFDAGTGLLSNYYYHRGYGALRRRVVAPARVIDNPLNWPASEVVAHGSKVKFDAGNVNATVIKGTHYLSFYSGKAPDTAVLVSAHPAPSK
jgi:hypothetical protein